MRILKIFGWLALAGAVLAVLGAGVGVYALWHFGRGLPDYEQLADYQPPVTTRVHGGDGRLIGEFAREHRLFVPYEAMPKRVVEAFLAAEDKNFFRHPGVDFRRVVLAGIQNLVNAAQNRRPLGASTITQQVAKNFLLTNEVSIQRKVREAILSFRMERAFTKERILELYLNEIYLGAGAYGVAAAALTYFDKSLDQLTPAEAALLAALPKAPKNYNPVRFPERAKIRRDWVLDQMAEEGYVSAAELREEQSRPVSTRLRGETEVVRAEWFTEELRRGLLVQYGEKGLYEGGLSVRSTLDTEMQRIGEMAVRNGLLAFDRRHGWRGPIEKLNPAGDLRQQLAQLQVAGLLSSWRTAAVRSVDASGAEIVFPDGATGRLALEDMRWARRNIKETATVGPPVRQPGDVLAVGDVIAVEPLGDGKPGFALRQIPEVSGALVAMDPHTGRILALVGGWDFRISQFNRATQAQRQPGSSFKPFVYAAALDNGFTPSSLVLDAPFVFDPGGGQAKWKPDNYTREFYGPSTLRLGIEKSRNLMTVRLAQAIGMDKVVDSARRFGIVENMPELLPMSLGAGETTLLRLTTAYAELVNGGKRVMPTLIDRVQDRNGKTIYRHDGRACDGCGDVLWENQREPALPDVRPAVVDPATAYQVVSMMQGVVERGTGVRIREVGKPLAGKTGTSNESFDAWFVGFSPDLAVGVFVGYDTPRTMGAKETGSSVAVPIFRDFMSAVLKDKPAIPFRVPSGVRLVRVNAETGMLARPGDRNVILEAFKPGTEPSGDRIVLDGSDEQVAGTGAASFGPREGAPSTERIAAPSAGTGGLY
jgi:penicillin-binding protein 1A